jgi:DNA-binding CsgD family transcriptional regulator
MIRGPGHFAHTTFVVCSERMSCLTEADYRGVLGVVRAAGEVEGPLPFTEPVLDALWRLVPCDVVAYHERVGGEAALAYVGEPRGLLTPEVREASRRYWHQSPLTLTVGARMYSDFFSVRGFHALELYQHVARPLGVEDMIRLWLDPSVSDRARLEFDRAQRDFTERDRAVLDLVRPHLEQFRRRATHRRAASGAASGLTPREREILGLVEEGRTNIEIARLLWISPGTVRKHLENAYEKLDVHTRTAAVAVLRALQQEEPASGDL